MAKKLGRPKLELTNEQIKNAGRLAGIGCNNEQIAHIMDMSPATFDRRISENPVLSEALAKGRANANAKVQAVAYEMAVNGKNPYMTCFWLKCRLRWSEPKESNPDDSEQRKPIEMNYKK